MALKEATKEALYLSNSFYYLNKELKLGYTYEVPKILEDNQAAKKLAENPKFHKKSKHISLQYHFTREAIARNKIALFYIPTQEQLADFLTKNVSNPLHKGFINLANLAKEPLKGVFS